MEVGHRQIAHTADLALELWAPSEETLLLEGARALVEILTEGAPIAGRERRVVEVESVDPEDRLVRWLNEVLVLAVTEGFLLSDAELTLREGGLRGECAGEAGAAGKIRTELKSVTYHDLRLEHREGRWTAQIVVDV
jgi:SHS2 domain-containing protein